jgi:TPR repeat protein
MYGTGRGVPQDDVQAVKWFRLAADQGLAKAQSHLSFMYHDGRGVPQDDVQAQMWFNLAAAQGDENGKMGRD